MNRLLTGGCIVAIIVLGWVVILIWKAIREQAMRNDDYAMDETAEQRLKRQVGPHNV